MVYVGTGKYLGTSDVSNTQTQSIYGLKDTGILAKDNIVSGAATAAPVATLNVRDGTLISQTLTVSGNTRTATHNQNNSSAYLNTHNGWYIDLPFSKERANTDPQVAYGVLVFTTNIPDSSPCSIYGGTSWLNYLDYATGGAVRLANGTYATASKFLGNTLSSRATIIWANGRPYVIGSKTDDSRFKEDMPIPGTSKRVSWREVVSN